MAEYFWGCIQIGGRLKKELLPDLHHAMIEEINDSSADEIMNDLQACCTKPQNIEYTQSDARWGEFEGIQSFCTEHKLVYLTKSEAAVECDAQFKFFDGENETTVVCSSDFDPAISKYHLMEFMKHIKELCGDIAKVPLVLDSKDFHISEVAKIILKHNTTNPIEVLEILISERYPDAGDVPALEIY